MSDHSSDPRSKRLNQIIAEFLEAIASGEEPDRDELIGQYPDLADDLKSFLADHDRMKAANVLLAINDQPSAVSEKLRTESCLLNAVPSADGRWLADGFRLWNLQNPAANSKPLFAEYRQKTLAVALSPDGRWGVARGQYGTSRLWDLQALDAKENLAKHSKLLPKSVGTSVDSLVLSSDGRWLAIGGFRGVLCDLKTADPALSVKRFWAQDEKQHPYLGAFAFSPDSRWLITGGEGTRPATRLWDLQASDPSATVRVLPFKAMCTFSPDSRWLLTGSIDGTVRRWELNVNRLMASIRTIVGRELTPEERQIYSVDANGRPYH